MGGGDYFYDGANYGLDPDYNSFSRAYSPGITSGIGLATDARTANQLKAASEKLSTGAKAVEVGAISPDVFESIPKQHFEELNKLRKLVGDVELTLHAPLIEPSGMSKRGWDPNEQMQAERQMTDAIEKAHELNPDGNVVTTFHSSAIGIPTEFVKWVEGEKPGEKEMKVTEAVVVDERTGNVQLATPKKSFLEGKSDVKEEIEKMNRANWFKSLQHINYGAEQGAHIIEKGLDGAEVKIAEKEENDAAILKLYENHAQGDGKKVEKMIERQEKLVPGAGEMLNETMRTLTHGDIYLRDAYNDFSGLFDQAYAALRKSEGEKAKKDLERLEEFRQLIGPRIEHLKKPENVQQFAEMLRQGVSLMRSVDVPQVYKPFKEFLLDKSSDTFSNVAFDAYKKFKGNAPVISIENPPAGSPLSSADEMRDLIKASRDKFARAAEEKLNISRAQADREAEKLIGATWDVGHINMIRKFGAGKEELKEETKKIAPYVKHMHLSDNFGLEHTELPMGMGNVPTQDMMKEVLKYNKDFKKISETGNWYQHFQTTPFAESMQHFESPIYAMKNNSYWGPQSYFAGYGMNPEIHHSLFGAGFANLPVELGGQMQGRSRVSGAPID